LKKGQRISNIIQRQKLIEQNPQIPPDSLVKAMSVQDLEIILKDAINGTSVQVERFNHPFSLESLKSEKNWMASYSELSWVRVRTYMWALNLSGNEILMIERNSTDGNYDCLSRIKYSGTKHVFRHDTLESAFNAAYTYVIKKFGYNSSKIFHTSAEWRKRPVSEGQTKLLQKWEIEIWDGIKRGQASDLLLKRRLGAIQETRKIHKVEEKMIKDNFLPNL
jgi:hypothetical protein